MLAIESGDTGSVMRALGKDSLKKEKMRPVEVDSATPSEGLRWVDLIWEKPSDLKVLSDLFPFDRAAKEDIVDIEQLPKFDEYDDHLFVVLHALTHDGDRIDTVEIDCFVTDGLLVTVHRTGVVAIDWLWENVQKYPHLTDEGSNELFGHLAEAIGRRYLEVAAEFERRVDLLAEPALAGEVQVVGEIQQLRREESTIRSMLRPQRYVISELLRMDRLDGADARRQLTDAYDVHNQVVEALMSIRSLLTDALDTYRGSVAERQARVSTLLTVYSAIVLPMTLIAGWYGMNTENLPAAAQPWGWIVVTVVMGLVGLASWLAFVRVGLVGRRRPVRDLGSAMTRVAKAPLRRSVMLENHR